MSNSQAPENTALYSPNDIQVTVKDGSKWNAALIVYLGHNLYTRLDTLMYAAGSGKTFEVDGPESGTSISLALYKAPSKKIKSKVTSKEEVSSDRIKIVPINQVSEDPETKSIAARLYGDYVVKEFFKGSLGSLATGLSLKARLKLATKLSTDPASYKFTDEEVSAYTKTLDLTKSDLRQAWVPEDYTNTPYGSSAYNKARNNASLEVQRSLLAKTYDNKARDKVVKASVKQDIPRNIKANTAKIVGYLTSYSPQLTVYVTETAKKGADNCAKTYLVPLIADPNATFSDESTLNKFAQDAIEGMLEAKPTVEDKLLQEEVEKPLWLAPPIPYKYTKEELDVLIEPGATRIGYTTFLIPPDKISYSRKALSTSEPMLRSGDSTVVGKGQSIRTLDFHFTTIDANSINKVILPLLLQFQRVPFLPIDNMYINDILGISAVAINNVQVKTVQGYPNQLDVTVSAEEFSWHSYLPGEEDFDATFCYPLLKIWTYAKKNNIPISPLGFDGVFELLLPDEEWLSVMAHSYSKSNMMTPEFEKVSTETSFAYLEKIEDYFFKNPTETYRTILQQDYPIKQEVAAAEWYLKVIPFCDLGISGLGTGIKDVILLKPHTPKALQALLNETNGTVLRIKAGTVDATITGTSGLSKAHKVDGLEIADQAAILEVKDDLRKAVKPGGILPQGQNNYIFMFTDGSYKTVYKEKFIVGNNTVRQKTTLRAKAEKASASASIEQTAFGSTPGAIDPNLDIPKWQRINMPSLIVEQISASSENMFARNASQGMGLPLHQFLGRSDTIITVEGTITDEEDVKTLRRLLEIQEYQTRKYAGIAGYEGYIWLKNEIAGLFGIKYAVPINCKIDTVEGMPGEHKFVLMFTKYDQEQKKRAMVNEITPSKAHKKEDGSIEIDASGRPLEVTSDTLFEHAVRAQDFRKVLAGMELYPDLKLPLLNELRSWLKQATTSEDSLENLLDDVGLDVEEFPWSASYLKTRLTHAMTMLPVQDGYAEPDFYCGPSMPYGAEALDAIIHASAGYQKIGKQIVKNAAETGKVYPGVNMNTLDRMGMQGVIHNFDPNNKSEKQERYKNWIPEYLDSKYKGYYPDKNLSENLAQDVAPPTTLDFSNTSTSSGIDAAIYQASVLMGVPYGVTKKVIEAEGGFGHDKQTDPAKAAAMLGGRYYGVGQVTADTLILANNQISKAATAMGKTAWELWTNSMGLTELNGSTSKMVWTEGKGYKANLQPVDRANMSYGAIAGMAVMRAKYNSLTEKLVANSKNTSYAIVANTIKYNDVIPELYKPLDSLLWQIAGVQYRRGGYSTGGVKIVAELFSLQQALSNITKDNELDSRRAKVIASGYYAIAPNSKIDKKIEPEKPKKGYDPNAPVGPLPENDYTLPEDKLPYHLTESSLFHPIKDPSGLVDGSPRFYPLDKMFIRESLDPKTQKPNWDHHRDMWYDMRNFSMHNRLCAAFPTYSLILVDGGQWLRFWRLYDHLFGLTTVQSIEVFKSRKTPGDVATIMLANPYGKLTKEPHWPFRETDRHWTLSYVMGAMQNALFGTWSPEELNRWNSVRNSLLLKAGCRIHLRMGYGSQANRMPMLFNGTITDVTPGSDVVEIAALGDGAELTNKLMTNASNKDGAAVTKSHTLMGAGTNPREVILGIMAPATPWNIVTQGLFDKANPHGISNFGSPTYLKLHKNASEVGMNIYAVTEAAVQCNKDVIADSVAWKEAAHALNVIPGYGLVNGDGQYMTAISMEDATAWDVFTTCRRVSPGYICAAYPFGLESRLFFGKPFWPLRYDYRSLVLSEDEQTVKFSAGTGGGCAELENSKNGYLNPANLDYITEWKPFSQIHVISSYSNLIKNEITASADDVYTMCQSVGSYNGLFKKDGADDWSEIQYLDTDILPEHQKMLYVTNGLYTTTAQKVIDGMRNLKPLTGMFTRKSSDTYSINALRDSVMDMYKGHALIVGDPSIKPHDWVYLSDLRTEMVGMFTVKEVIHLFSWDTGMVSTVSPDLMAEPLDVAHQFGWEWTEGVCTRWVGSFATQALIGEGLRRNGNAWKIAAKIHLRVAASLREMRAAIKANPLLSAHYLEVETLAKELGVSIETMLRADPTKIGVVRQVLINERASIALSAMDPALKASSIATATSYGEKAALKKIAQNLNTVVLRQLKDAGIVVDDALVASILKTLKTAAIRNGAISAADQVADIVAAANKELASRGVAALSTEAAEAAGAPLASYTKAATNQYLARGVFGDAVNVARETRVVATGEEVASAIGNIIRSLGNLTGKFDKVTGKFISQRWISKRITEPLANYLQTIRTEFKIERGLVTLGAELSKLKACTNSGELVLAWERVVKVAKDTDLAKLLVANGRGPIFHMAIKVGRLAWWMVLVDGLAEFLNRKMAKRQTLILKPLMVGGRELTAGINGHLGCVVGDHMGFFDNVLSSWTNWEFSASSIDPNKGILGNAGGYSQRAVAGLLLLLGVQGPRYTGKTEQDLAYALPGDILGEEEITNRRAHIDRFYNIANTSWDNLNTTPINDPDATTSPASLAVPLPDIYEAGHCGRYAVDLLMREGVIDKSVIPNWNGNGSTSYVSTAFNHLAKTGRVLGPTDTIGPNMLVYAKPDHWFVTYRGTDGVLRINESSSGTPSVSQTFKDFMKTHTIVKAVEFQP